MQKPPEPRARPSSSVGLVGTIGGALDEGAPRYGGALRGRLGFASWIGVALSAGASVRPKDQHELALRFLDAGIGLGFVLERPSPIGRELTVEAVIESFRADADADGTSDSGERILPAARAELDFVWAVAPPVELLVGADLFARPASTTIKVEGESVGSTGVLEVGVAAGARFPL